MTFEDCRRAIADVYYRRARTLACSSAELRAAWIAVDLALRDAGELVAKQALDSCADIAIKLGAGRPKTPDDLNVTLFLTCLEHRLNIGGFLALEIGMNIRMYLDASGFPDEDALPPAEKAFLEAVS